MQYRLRTLLVSILVISVPLAAVSTRIAGQRAEQATERLITSLGGVAMPRTFDDCEDQEAVTIAEFCRALYRGDPSAEIFIVSLRDCKRVQDKDIERLRNFESLGVLDVRNTSVTDACIPALEALHRLVWLDIAGTRITESGSRRLRRSLPNCQIFTVDD